MKRNILYILSFALLFGFFSCETEVPDPWYSSTTELDGNWYVRYDHATYGVDPFGVGFVENYTYNTSSNDGTEMWLEDHGNFWDYKVKVPVNTNDLTFGGVDTVMNSVDGYEIKVIIKNGKIIKDAVTMPSTLVVDSIYYEVWFEDLEGATGIADDVLYVAGVRKTGFAEDHP